MARGRSQRVAEFRAIVRLMPNGSRRVSIRVDSGHKTVHRSDRKLAGAAMEAINDEMHRHLHDAIRDGLAVAERARELTEQAGGAR